MSDREIVCEDLNLALDDLRGEGFRLETIYPADDPHTAIVTRGGTFVRVTTRPDAPPPPGELPPFRPEFVLTRASEDAGEGRAGMYYRDLVPGRLGGRYIASHITINQGGPVADWVHFHDVALQLIAVGSGWVRVVYEDQGEPFVMQPGDMVLQPPGIRHRVLESSPGLEVIEIGCPALHRTHADHDLALPCGEPDSQRLFNGQRFLRHLSARTAWTRFGEAEAQETAMKQASAGLVQARILRPRSGSAIHVPPASGELDFAFVLEGSGTLDHCGRHALGSGDAFVIPPGEGWRVTGGSPDLRLLHVVTARLDSA